MKNSLGHPSDLLLARILLGKAAEEERRFVEAHARTCARCRAELEGAREARRRFAQTVLPRTLPALELRLSVRRRWRSLLSALGLAAGAAAALAVVALALPERAPAYQAKGAGVLKIFGRREGRVFPVEDGARLRPGDQIRFGVEAGGAAFALVASIDGRGQANLYLPSTRLAPDAGPIELLPDSIVLDDAPGPERVFAIFSDRPLDSAQIAEALRALGASGAEAIRRTRRLPVPFPQASVLLEKLAPPGE